MLAAELGFRLGPRAQIVADIKRALVSLVDAMLDHSLTAASAELIPADAPASSATRSASP